MSIPTLVDYDQARRQMVTVQLQATGRDIYHPAVLAAMASVPRHEFVPEEVRDEAYEDHPLPIGFEQTISQPYIVAYMTQELRPRKSDWVLEIGTGSGYQAAVLSGLVSEVYSMELVEPLAGQAAATLKRLGYSNVHIKIGDGHEGWEEMAPFDAITVTCAPDRPPPALVAQLKEGGRMVIPVGTPNAQTLYVLTKRSGKMVSTAELPVRFVPMTGGNRQLKS